MNLRTQHIKKDYNLKFSLYFSAILTIVVEDENDNNPKFRRPFYRRSITENSKNGVTIINVVADDADKNRTITYSLEGMSCNVVILQNGLHQNGYIVLVKELKMLMDKNKAYF